MTMKFKPYVYSSLLIWLLLATGTLLFFKMHDEQESDLYDALMGQNRETDKGVLNTSQQRKNITKQLLFLNGVDRLEWRLKSDASTFHLNRTEGKAKLTEQLEKVDAVVQEEKTADHQIVRTIQADRAEYDYTHHTLIADDVTLGVYLVPSTHLLEKKEFWSPLMRGKARQFQLSRKANRPLIYAEEFQGMLSDWSGFSL